jgi:hypothetical protein
MGLAQAHFFQAVVKALWIIGNFISNELKGPASARSFAAKVGRGGPIASPGKGIHLCLWFKFLPSANRMGAITTSHTSARLWGCVCSKEENLLGVRGSDL